MTNAILQWVFKKKLGVTEASTNGRTRLTTGFLRLKQEPKDMTSRTHGSNNLMWRSSATVEVQHPEVIYVYSNRRHKMLSHCKKKSQRYPRTAFQGRTGWKLFGWTRRHTHSPVLPSKFLGQIPICLACLRHRFHFARTNAEIHRRFPSVQTLQSRR